MNDLILELLQARGGMTLAHLIATLGADGNRAESILIALKAEGKVRQDQCVIPKWHNDTDYQCNCCNKKFPEVRRSSNKKICTDCYYVIYKSTNGGQRLREPRPPKGEQFSRFDEFWIGPSWAGRRSQEILTKARLSA